MKFVLNQEIVVIDESLGNSTLDFLRKKGMKGVKEACHEGECGACMVLLGELKDKNVEYKAVTSCILPLGEIVGKHVVTIEGLNQDKLSPIQQALVDEGASQCGFCTPGFVVSLTGFFLNEKLEKKDILTSIEGNLCRCGAYAAIIRSTEKLAKEISVEDKKSKERIQQLIEIGILPAYFLGIPNQLEKLKELSEINLQEKGKYVAGATDLLVQHESLSDPIFLSEKKLSGISLDGEYIYIGATTSMEDIRTSEELNSLLDTKQDISLVSAFPIRLQATLGGNLVNASPIGDLIIYFLALDADISLKNEKDRRIIKLRDFYKDYKIMDINEGEIVEWLRINSKERFFNFEKVARRKYMDIASVNSAISFDLNNDIIQNAHLSAGGVAPVPKYLEKTSNYLENKKISEEIIKEAVKIADSEVSPIDDVRGSARYKRLLLRQLIYAHFLTLFPELEVSL
ncbi:MAG: FAD binding domain-containing protein [Candidatus Heimdallarchaeaceae archaeon]